MALLVELVVLWSGLAVLGALCMSMLLQGAERGSRRERGTTATVVRLPVPRAEPSPTSTAAGVSMVTLS